MKKISNSDMLSIFTKLLILLVIAKLISFVIWIYLPINSTELSVRSSFIQKYKHFSFKNMIKQDKKQQKNNSTTSGPEVSMTSMLLKGLYGSKNKGYIIVAMKSNIKKTSIVGVGELYQSYKLKSILKDSVLFSKNGRNFVLAFKKINNKKYITKVKKNKNLSTSNSVSKKDISFYFKNPKQIWKDISIGEVKSGKKLKGFRVNRIRAGSRFATLGLKKGDIIIKANNVKLESYRDAMNVYKNAKNLDAIDLIVLRNNQEVELVYEIN